MSVVEIGNTFGALVVESMYDATRASGAKRRMAACRCLCGNEAHVEKYNLTSGNTRQCQYCAKHSRKERRRRHGHSYHAEGRSAVEAKCYNAWLAMKQRCYNAKDKRYSDYGGRGIYICESWRSSYETFLADMGLPPSLDHQVDRKDNGKGYSPDNCHWADRYANCRNKRNNHLITAFGETKTLVEWANETGLNRETIARRLNAGESPEKALRTKLSKPGKVRAVICPAGEFETITDCAKAIGMSTSGVYGRINSSRQPEWRYAN